MGDLARRTVPQTDMSLCDMGEMFAQSGFFSDSRHAAQAVVKIQAGRELGFPPVASMTGVHIIKGRVALSANLMAAAIKATGKYNYRVREHTDSVCRIEFYEAGESVGISEFTMTDAKQAGLLSNSTWKAYPRNMLFSRCLSNGARWYCPDIFGGSVYSPEELGANVDEDGVVITCETPTARSSQDDSPMVNDSPMVTKAMKSKLVEDYRAYREIDRATAIRELSEEYIPRLLDGATSIDDNDIDAFVLVRERLDDDIRQGRDILQAIQDGCRNAAHEESTDDA